MKTDKELLELAAKAADLNIKWRDMKGGYERALLTPKLNGKWWNPIADDGDAFRLAVKLNLGVDVSYTWINIFYNNKVLVASPVIVSEKIEITRRAIVRAAAAIGESR